MLRVSNVDELKAAIEAELTAKSTEIVAIFQREFPEASLSNTVEGYGWSGNNNVFSDNHELLSKHLSLKLPSGLETLVVIEFGLSEEYEKSISLRHIMLNCFLHSRIFSDDENPFFIISSWEEKGSWDTSPPPMGDAYERVTRNLFKLMSGLRFSLNM